MDELNSYTFFSHSGDETFKLGEAFGMEAPRKGMIALIGPLGAGKTLFVRGLAEGLEVSDSSVSSPTYTLVHSHKGRLSLAHVDLYRLADLKEIRALGLEEVFEGEGISAVEWAEKGLEILPPQRMTIRLNCLDGNKREIVMEAKDKPHRGWIECVLRGIPSLKLKKSEVP